MFESPLRDGLSKNIWLVIDIVHKGEGRGEVRTQPIFLEYF
jgi:hypothetical protein